MSARRWQERVQRNRRRCDTVSGVVGVQMISTIVLRIEARQIRRVAQHFIHVDRGIEPGRRRHCYWCRTNSGICGAGGGTPGTHSHRRRARSGAVLAEPTPAIRSNGCGGDGLGSAATRDGASKPVNCATVRLDHEASRSWRGSADRTSRTEGPITHSQHPSENRMPSNKSTAHLTGAIYAVLVISGMITLLYVPSKLIVEGDIATTVTRIIASEVLFGSGIPSAMV